MTQCICVSALAEQIEPTRHEAMHCPCCHARHIDAGEWAIRPHHKHLCATCGHVWRVEPYTFGVGGGI
jgi:hypothetical protein